MMDFTLESNKRQEEFLHHLDSVLPDLKTPCYVVDETLLLKNLEILARVKQEAGCKILLAQKGFSLFKTYPLIAQYLDGTTASSLFEARLGYEEMGKSYGKQTHIFSPAFQEHEMEEILQYVDHVVFNSIEQWLEFKDRARTHSKSCGLRINPEYAEVETELYNPCGEYSRLGMKLENIIEALEQNPNLLDGIEGFHFHTMCQQNADVLVRTLAVFEEKFSFVFPRLKWINFGGGHHITRSDYEIDVLIQAIQQFRLKYNVEVYLEPGEAIALNTGFLIASVVDILPAHGDIQPVIMDTSAACHMPDVIEMPYRPFVLGAGNKDQKAYNYRLGGPSCLAGDVIGDYSFSTPLQKQDKLVLFDMAHYTMVKNNTFNGIGLPSIYLWKQAGTLELVKQFTYFDFKNRLS